MTTKTPTTIPTAEQLQLVAPSALKGADRNSRTHSAKQVKQLADSIRTFGFVSPIIAQADGTVIAGHGRLAAAEKLKLDRVPVLFLDHLTPEQARAYLIADNRLAELAGWDEELLGAELLELDQLAKLSTANVSLGVDFDLSVVGFDEKELGRLIALAGGPEAPPPRDRREGEFSPPARPIAQRGDAWALGGHRLLVADATAIGNCRQLLELLGESAVPMVLADPPAAPKDADEAPLRAFLQSIAHRSLELLAPFGHAYAFCSWRTWSTWFDVANEAGLECKNMIVWDKAGAGLGAMYAHTHELVLFGEAPEGRGFRRRTIHDQNVWRFQRVANGSGKVHPEQKPVDMLERAIRNSTDEGECVVDLFGGAGSALIACENLKRRCGVIELDPRFADSIILRWQHATGGEARHVDSGDTYAARKAARSA